MTEVDDYILTEDESYDVVIVGGGVSGLCAAQELKKHEPELKFKIVEAKDRLGGRTKTISLNAADGRDKWDIGGQWVGRTQRHLLELMKELGVEKYDQFSDGIKWMQIGRFKPRTYTSDLPKASEIGQYSVFELINFLIAYPKLIKLIESINLKNLHETPNAKDLDALTVEQWFKQTVNDRFFVDIGEVSTMSVYGVPAARMSMLYYCYYAKSAGRLEDLFECTKNGAQAFRIKVWFF
uniref:Amine oxidase n=1 Tax=Panagrolaimus davidi TaxID=227884 RepID=A0A914Q9H4_9BILA